MYTLQPKFVWRAIMKCNYENNTKWKIALMDRHNKEPCLINFKEEQKRMYGSNYWD